MSRLEYQPNREDENEDLFLNEEQEQDTEQRLAAPDDRRLQQVEQMLRQAPLLSVPIGFADRVLAALKGQDKSSPDYQNGLGIVLGIFLAALLAVPLFGTPIYLIGRAIASGEGIQSTFEEVAATLASVWDWLVAVPLSSGFLLPFIIGALIGFGLLSGYIFWFVRSTLKGGS